jgi:site-specific DNA-methyltransferase (adenine-specific)
MRNMPSKHYDLAIVDIEYGIGASAPTDKDCTVRQKNGTIMQVKKPNYQKKDWDFKKSGAPYFEQLFRVSKKQIIWGGNYYGLSGGYIVWNKLNGDSDQLGCELAWLSFTQRTDIVHYMWAGMMQGVYCGYDIKRAMVQQGNKKLNEKRIHPTQKPIILYKWLLKNYAKQGDKILDTHTGSFSIGIACHEMGFDIDACELDKDYYEAATKRYNRHISQQKLFPHPHHHFSP